MEILRLAILILAAIGIIYGLYKLLIGLPRETKKEFDKIDKDKK